MKRLRLRKIWVVIAVILLMFPLIHGSAEKTEATETTTNNENVSPVYTINFRVWDSSLNDGQGGYLPDDGNSMPKYDLTPPENSESGFSSPNTANIQAQIMINGDLATDLPNNYEDLKWEVKVNDQVISSGNISNDIMDIGENPIGTVPGNVNMSLEDYRKIVKSFDMTAHASGILQFTFNVTGKHKTSGASLNISRNVLITVPLQLYHRDGGYFNYTYTEPNTMIDILANNAESSQINWFYQDAETDELVKLPLPPSTENSMPTTSQLISGIGNPVAHAPINNTTVYSYAVNVGKYGGFSRLVARIYLNNSSTSDNYIEKTFDLFIKAHVDESAYPNKIAEIEYGQTIPFSKLANDLGNSLEWYAGRESSAQMPTVVDLVSGQGVVGKSWGEETLTLTPVPVYNSWENWDKINNSVRDQITFKTAFAILKGSANTLIKADNYEVVDMGGNITLSTNVVADGHTFNWQYKDGNVWRQLDISSNGNEYLDFVEGVSSGNGNSMVTLLGKKAGVVTLRCVVTGNDINGSNGSTVSGSNIEFGLTQTINIRVIDSLILSDSYKTIPVGKSFELSAESSITGDISWVSENPELVMVDPEIGNKTTVTGLQVTNGEYITITATQTSTGRTAICRVRVVDAVSEVTIEGPEVIAKGATEEYKLVFANGTPSYTKDQIKWVLKNKGGVDASTILEVIPNPTDYTRVNINALAAGEAYLAVVTNDSFETEIAIITIKVVSSPEGLELSDENVTGYLPDETYQLSYTILPKGYVEEGLTINWRTSDASIATVDSNGLVTYHAIGKVIITATVSGVPAATDACYFDIQNPVESITLNPNSATIKVGGKVTITPTISPDNVTDTSLSWTSSNPSIATVDNTGVVTGIAAGGTTITCTTSNGLTATSTVTVLQPAASITLNYDSITVKKNTVFYLSAQILPTDAYDKTVIWSSSDEALATVSEDGTVTALGVGVVTITATSVDNPDLVAECIVTIVEDVSGLTLNAREKTIKVGEEFLLVPTIHPSDAENRGVTFTSSDPTIASVDANGVIKGLKGGVVIITVKTVERGLMATCTITVQEDITGITLNETDIYIGKGANKQITYTLAPASATQKRLNWSSSDPSIVIVDAYGNIHGVNLGTAIITATAMDGSGVKATCKVTVVEQGTSITLNEEMIKLMEGEQFQLTYTILPPTTSIQKVEWSSSDTSIVKVDASGMVTAVKEGQANIRVSMTDGSGLFAVCTVIVTPANPITSIRVNTTETTMVSGESRTFTARVVPRDTTESFTWVSSDTSVVRIDGNGNAVAAGPGTCTLTAVSSKGGIEGSCTVTVLGLTASSINLEQYDTYDLYLDGVPTGVTWFSRNKRVATVNNRGVVTARQPGTTTIVARMNGKLVSCEITVEKIPK